MTVDTQKLRGLLAGLPLVAWSKTRSTVAIPETEDFAGKDLHITGLDKQYARKLAAYISAVNPATVSALLDEIDRLRAALKVAKAEIQADREALLLCHGLDGEIPANDTAGLEGLAEYDEVLNTITAALGSGNGDAT